MVFGLALVLALVFGAISMALAATGGNFILGKANTAGEISRLTANIAHPTLQLINTSTATAATALNLHVANGNPPMTVNSSTKVARLNSDQVDGKNSTDLVPGGVVPAGTTIRGNYEIDGSSANGSELIGGDSISFGYTLPSTPQTRFIAWNTTPPAECPGTEASPQAQPGYLCIYETNQSNVQSGYPLVYNQGPVGAALFVYSAGTGTAYSYGRWAVTAPQAAQETQLSSPQKSSAATAQRPQP